MGLIDKLANSLAADRPRAFARYVEILTDDVDDAAQVDELTVLLAKLDKTVDHVQADTAILKRVKPLQATHRAGQDLQDALAAARRGLTAFEAAEADRLRGVAAQRAELARELSDVQSREQAACDAAVELIKLKSQNPELLAGLTPPPDPNKG